MSEKGGEPSEDAIYRALRWADGDKDAAVSGDGILTLATALRAERQRREEAEAQISAAQRSEVAWKHQAEDAQTLWEAAEAKLAQEHENFLAAHRDNIKGATLLMECEAKLARAEAKLVNIERSAQVEQYEILEAKLAQAEKDLAAAKERIKELEATTCNHKHLSSDKEDPDMVMLRAERDALLAVIGEKDAALRECRRLSKESQECANGTKVHNPDGDGMCEEGVCYETGWEDTVKIVDAVLSLTPPEALDRLKAEIAAEVWKEAAGICKEQGKIAVNYYKDVGRNGMIVLAINNAGLIFREKSAALRAVVK